MDAAEIENNKYKEFSVAKLHLTFTWEEQPQAALHDGATQR